MAPMNRTTFLRLALLAWLLLAIAGLRIVAGIMAG